MQARGSATHGVFGHVLEFAMQGVFLVSSLGESDTLHCWASSFGSPPLVHCCLLMGFKLRTGKLSEILTVNLQDPGRTPREEFLTEESVKKKKVTPQGE